MLCQQNISTEINNSCPILIDWNMPVHPPSSEATPPPCNTLVNFIVIIMFGYLGVSDFIFYTRRTKIFGGFFNLLNLFSMFCFRCMLGQPKVKMQTRGTMVTVYQHGKEYGGEPFTWRRQPCILGG